LRKNLLDDGIEIGAGLGEFAGKVVRIGKSVLVCDYD
jgi:aspartate aminotransferase-like enzyme